MRALAAGLVLAAALNAVSRPWRALPARPLPALSPETAVETAGLLSLGLRRLAADLQLIRLLVYYGTPEPDEPGHEEPGHDHAAHRWGGGRYPEMAERARRIVALDPSFSYALLYAAGAIAFNLDRPDEALELVTLGLQLDPDNLGYKSYLGAIAFHKKGDMAKALALLEPTLAEPDCPTMIKSMAAFMYRRLGRRADAIRLYRDIAETSRDQGYVNTARRNLRELGDRP